MTYVLAALGFMVLIVLHEAGHFAAAKAVGMRVERFSLFFGPMLASFRRGETTYGIAAIPLGGYVKISGMSPYEELAPDVAGRAYFRQPVWKRVVVILAGPLVNLVIAFVLLWGLFVVHGTYRTTSTVAAVQAGEPASKVLRAGDRIVAVDGSTGDATQIRDRIAAHRCAGAQTAGCRATTPVALTVRRGARRLTFDLRPRYDAQVKRTRLGFGFGAQLHRDGIVGGGGRSVSEMWTVTSQTVGRVGKVFFSAKARKDVHGAVGAYEETRQAIKLGTAEGLYLLAVISLSLAVINLFPFLPLDGGHVFWALAEKVRGRRIPFSVMERAGFVGFALVIALFVIGLTNDINTLSGRGFGAP